MTPERFPNTVEALVARARQLDASTLYGASDLGHALAGAMVLQSGELQLWRPGEIARVLLVDGVVAGLLGVAVAGERTKTVGAHAVDALVLRVVGETRTSLGLSGMGRVVALRLPTSRQRRSAARRFGRGRSSVYPRSDLNTSTAYAARADALR